MNSTLTRDAYTLAAHDTDPEGTVVALVSVFGNVDLVGDRVMPGAFDQWLMNRRAAGKAVPIVWSHDWGSTDAILGYALPENIRPTAEGLVVKFQMDTSIPWAKAVYSLLQQQALEFSFGYQVVRERRGADGANELLAPCRLGRRGGGRGSCRER
jgi:HK97 family phage prohead protease